MPCCSLAAGLDPSLAGSSCWRRKVGSDECYRNCSRPHATGRTTLGSWVFLSGITFLSHCSLESHLNMERELRPNTEGFRTEFGLHFLSNGELHAGKWNERRMGEKRGLGQGASVIRLLQQFTQSWFRFSTLTPAPPSRLWSLPGWAIFILSSPNPRVSDIWAFTFLRL